MIKQQRPEKNFSQFHINFMQNIRRIRQERGWTQDKVASDMGVSRVHYTELEGGRNMPVIGTVEVVAKALGVDPLSLLLPCKKPPSEKKATTTKTAKSNKKS